MADLIFTTHEAAKVLGIHPFTVGRWIDSGLLKAHRTAGGYRRVRGPDLLRYLIEHGMPVPPQLAGSGGAQLKLLVIDGEAKALSAIRRAFKPLAAEVDLTLTTSPVDALLLLANSKPDGLLIDLRMPGLDGYEVCRRVAAFKPLAGTRVVAMTSLYRSDVVGNALRSGAVACLEKPVDPKEVLALIARPASGPKRRTHSKRRRWFGAASGR